jgi:hypothetical protein
MKRILIILVVCLLATVASHATIVYTNAFTSSADWTSTLPPDGFQVNFNSGGGVNKKARIRNAGVLTNTSPGRWAAFYKTTALVATNEYNPILANSTWPIVWSLAINDGFASSDSTVLYGNTNDTGRDAHGFVIGATSPDFRNAGDGYAIVVADGPDAGAQDTLQFIRYSGGLIGTVTPLLSWSSTDGVGLQDVGSYAVPVRLAYDPTSSEWTLSGKTGFLGGYADDFPDPLAQTYSAGETKSVIDSSYTSSSLGNIGFFLSTDATVPQAYIDNMVIQTIPESATLVLLGLVTTLLARRNRA